MTLATKVAECAEAAGRAPDVIPYKYQRPDLEVAECATYGGGFDFVKPVGMHGPPPHVGDIPIALADFIVAARNLDWKALLAAVKLAEAAELALGTKYERGCDGGEITYRGKLASANMSKAFAALAAFRAAMQQEKA